MAAATKTKPAPPPFLKPKPTPIRETALGVARTEGGVVLQVGEAAYKMPSQQALDLAVALIRSVP